MEYFIENLYIYKVYEYIMLENCLKRLLCIYI